MASLGDWAEYAGARLAAASARRLAPDSADALAVRLGTLGYRVMGTRRDITLDNLRQALGNHYSEPELQAIALRVFQNVARSLIEVTRFEVIRPEGIRQFVVAEGQEMVDRAYREGKGGIILTAHFGNWEMMGAWIAAIGYPMDLLVGIQHNPLIHDLFNRWRQHSGVSTINVGQASRLVLRGLQQNHFIGMAADQHAPSLGVILDFFGRPASFARGPAVFSLRSGCPILPFLLRRERYDRHILMAGEAIYPQSSGDEEQDVRSIMERYARFIESHIRKYPDQWMWTHRRWKVDQRTSGADSNSESIA